MTLHDLLKAICFYNYSVSVNVNNNKGLKTSIRVLAWSRSSIGGKEIKILILRLLYFSEIFSFWTQKNWKALWIKRERENE